MTEQSVVPAVGVSMKSIAGSSKDGTEMVLQTHFAGDATPEQMDEFLDILAGRLARQRQIGEIPTILEAIERCQKSIDAIATDTDRIDKQQQADWEASGRQGSARLSSANKKAREELSLNLDEWKRRLVVEEKKIKAAYDALNIKQPRAVKTA